MTPTRRDILRMASGLAASAVATSMPTFAALASGPGTTGSVPFVPVRSLPPGVQRGDRVRRSGDLIRQRGAPAQACRHFRHPFLPLASQAQTASGRTPHKETSC